MEISQEGVGQGTEEGDTAQAAGCDSKDEMLTQPPVQETSPTSPSSERKFEYSSERMLLTQARRKVFKNFRRKHNIIHAVPSSATAFEETDAPTDLATETGTFTVVATDSTSLASRTIHGTYTTTYPSSSKAKDPSIVKTITDISTAIAKKDLIITTAATDIPTATAKKDLIITTAATDISTATAKKDLIITTAATDIPTAAAKKDPFIVTCADTSIATAEIEPFITATGIFTARTETDPLIATTTDIHTARTIASTSADARATAGIETFIAPNPTDHLSATTAKGPSTGTAAGFSNASTQTTAAVITKNDTSTDDSSTSEDTDTSYSTDTSTDADTSTYTGHVRKYKHSLLRKFIEARKKPPQHKPIPASEDELFEFLESDD